MSIASFCSALPFSNSFVSAQPNYLSVPASISKQLPAWEGYQVQAVDEKLKELWITRLAAIPTPQAPIKAFPKTQRNVVTAFLPELGNQFYKAFMFGGSRPIASIYESQCIIAVYLHLFNTLFMCIRLLLKTVENTQQALIGTALAIGTLALGLWAYFKFSSGPSHIDFCQRVKVERTPLPLRDYTKAKDCRRVIVHGPRGMGKSAWLDGLMAEHIKNGKKVFKINNPVVFGDRLPGSGNSAERFFYIIGEAMRDPENTVIVCDEFGDATVGSSAKLANINKDVTEHLSQISLALKEAPGLTFVGVMLDEQWKLISEVDPALADRFVSLSFKKPADPKEEDAQVMAVLHKTAAEEAAGIPFSDGGLKAILDHITPLVKQDEGKFRKAVDFLREILNRISRNKEALDLPPSLEKARQAFLKLTPHNGPDSALNDPNDAAFAAYTAALAEAKIALDKEENAFIELQQNVKALIELQRVLASKLQERNSLARHWVKSNDKAERAALEKRIDYIHYAEKRALETAIAALKPKLGHLRFEIDEEAVKQFALQK